MRCPVCGVEMCVKSRSPQEQEGQSYILLRLACRSRQCPNFGKQVTEKAVKADH